MRVSCVQFRAYLGKALFACLLGSLSVVLAGLNNAPKDQGIGGTGYIGTIVDFGSIVINGREIEVDDSTRVRVDGAPGTIADLKKGHFIAARSNNIGGAETAVTIDVIKIVAGKLDQFDNATGLGVILGQVIDFNSRLDFETLTVGNWYSVSGLRAENDVVIASLIESSSEGAFLLRGKSSQIQTALMDLNVKDRRIPKGDTLVLSGAIRSGKVRIEKLQAYSLIATLQQPSEILVETYIRQPTSQDRVVDVDQIETPFVLTEPVRNIVGEASARVVLKAQKSARRFMIREIGSAPFADRASEASKSLSKRMIDDLSLGVPEKSDGSESEVETENENQSGETESETEKDGTGGSQNGQPSGDGGNDSGNDSGNDHDTDPSGGGSSSGGDDHDGSGGDKDGGASAGKDEDD